MARQTRASQRSVESPQSTGDAPGATTAGSGGAPPPASPPSPAPEDGDDPRRVAHEIVGQAHAVLVIAHRDDVLEHWCPADLRVAVLDARTPLWVAIGDLQAAIAGGTYDTRLIEAGIGGALSRPKRKGLRAAVEYLWKAVRSSRGQSVRKWLKSAAGFARTAVGSIAREIPGGEVIAEALDAVMSGLDTVEALETHGEA